MISTSRTRMTRFFLPVRCAFVAAVLLGGVGCACKQPWMVAPPAQPETEVAYVESDDPTIYIIIQPPEAPASPEVVVQQAPPARSDWMPEALPAPNPFKRFRTWIGDYDCVQGNTGMVLRIMDVRGSVVRAIFDFMHAPSGAQGSYLIMGTFDAATRRVRFEPSKWIARPNNYVMVPMEGEISRDNSFFAGKIDFPGCGAFHLKPQR